MAPPFTYTPVSSQRASDSYRPMILLGVTDSQTCVVLVERVRAFKDAGFRVALIASQGETLATIAGEGNVDVYPITMRRGISLLADLKCFLLILRTVRRIRPDLTEFSTPKAGLLGSLAAVLCGIRVRIYFVRGLRLETEHGWRRQILRATEWLSALCSHLVICNSPSLRAQVLAMKLAPQAKLCLLGDGSSNGVDIERFHPRRQSVSASDGSTVREPVLGFVGRLTRDKGIPQLIQAFDELLEEIPNARLLLVGWFDKSEDALSDDLRTYIDGHPSITRTGLVADTAPYYHRMDLMVLPTFREGFPNVVLEAAASGIPVITTRVTGARDSIVPEVTGLLIEVGDPRAICAACIELLRDPQRRMSMGTAAREWVAERFRNDRVLGLTVTLYEDLLLRPSPPEAALAVKAEPLPGQ